mmetsp:Transcript_62198/g.148392  ORF Transcript_62198/g.148392 Transcript_62198/m.148392 type:complete len:275 (+) Transcript_62198:72-896(+)|eukprot:CAMPEP_0178420670 /NCGR_PEP_ID=MMETSP0689_2-20121128/26252_1 /TAXON_ID=160604 /ORGANISM="Amphidinium massartii, Strain CS-259" /LENGTH=274 /DNA_ID=CAMNT_0020042159 /DNA_START=77 /DNA_END=901 /DNA_ORIENTATION=-
MPVKFDDIPKTAAEVLGDDYVVSGYSFKAKQKTNFDGAVVTTSVDLFGKDAVQTPAKLSWKFPKPFGVAGLVIDKFEMDKAGKFKVEASADKALHKVADVKIEAKSDLVDPSKISAGVTYTGLKDALVKVETKPASAKDLLAEVTYAVGPATVGLKYSGGACDIGCRVLQGPLFGSILATGNLKVFTGHLFYKVNDKMKVACTGIYGGKAGGTVTIGCAYDVAAATKAKAKVSKDGVVCCSLKHDISKGFTATVGGKYNTVKGDSSFGLSLSVE